MCACIVFITNCSCAQDWFFCARFKVINIRELASRDEQWHENGNEDRELCYLVTVELIDTDSFSQLAIIYGERKTYKGTRFSIVSIGDECLCPNSRIKKGNIIFLNLSLWSRVWAVGHCLPRHSIWPWDVNGFRIPIDYLYSQPMKAKELNGLCYTS